MKKSIAMYLAAVLALGLGGVALAQDGKMSLTGAGATFPFPIYSKWFDEYKKMKGNIEINYQPIGSGGGIRQVTSGTVDFGASDGPMSDEQLAQTKVPILHFPTVLGSDVPTYNIPGITEALNFSREAIAGIYLGSIKKWNDPAIAKHNPKVKLPAENIIVVRRSDGSGTTYIWTDFLSKISDEWKNSVGRGTSVNWPVGLGGKGNDGVTGLVKQTPYSIGYVELGYALQNKLAYGRIQNAANEFVLADLATTTAAAAGAAKSMPADFRVSITNAPGKTSYPVASFTWLLVPSTIQDASKKAVIKDFLKWMATDGQKYAEGLGYAPLPKEVVSQVLKSIDKVK